MSISHQAVVWQISGRQSSGSYLKIIRRSSVSCQGVIRKSSDCYQAVNIVCIPYVVIQVLSFFGYKIVLDPTNHFGLVLILLGQVQIIRISPENSNLNLTKIICTFWYPNKTIWTVQNHFGPIERKAIKSSFWDLVMRRRDHLLSIFTDL